MTTPKPRTIADLERELARVTAERDEARAERDELKEATERLIKAVKLFHLTGVPEIVTVDDLIQGMRNVAVKLDNASRSRSSMMHTAEKEQADDRIEGLKAALSRANDGMEQVASIVDPIVSNPGGELHTVELVAKLAKSFAALRAEKAALEQRVAELSRDVEELRGEGENSRPTWSELQQSLRTLRKTREREIDEHCATRRALETQLKEAREQLEDWLIGGECFCSDYTAARGPCSFCKTVGLLKGGAPCATRTK